MHPVTLSSHQIYCNIRNHNHAHPLPTPRRFMSSEVICLMVLQQHEVQIGTKVLSIKITVPQNNKLSIWGALLRNLMWRLKDKHSNGYTYCGKWAISENSSVDSKTTSVKWQGGVQQHKNLIKHTLPKIAFPCKIANHLLCTTKTTMKD